MYVARFVVVTATLTLFGQFTLAQTIAGQSNPVVAVVNGETIRRTDLNTARARLPEQYRSLPMKKLFQPLLNQLVRTKILALAARAEKLDQTDTHRKRLVFAEERLLEETLLKREIAAKVTEEALRAGYKEAVANFSQKDEVRARHILVKTESQARTIINKLAGGADFGTLARDRSIGPSKVRGGDLDYFGRGQMVPQFEEAVFALKKGEYTKEPVFTQFGWHIIKLEERRRSKPPVPKELRAKIKRNLTQNVVLNLVNKLTEKAKITRFEIDGAAPRLRRIQPSEQK
ncbi:MAG: peptidylprolyl isomerase [Pseudomonadota bacterium]|nr:peptidylprolyl isomerase [Pseudomonadota bacterium]